MPQKRKADQFKLIAEAALAQAGKTGWDRLTMRDVARKAKLDLSTVERHFKNKWQIVKWLLAEIDKDVEKAVRERLDGVWRDNLFEMLMTRFEFINKHRAAYESLSSALARNPKVAVGFVQPFLSCMRRMLKLAGAPEMPPHVWALGVLYISLVDAWKKDDTSDLSKTMAVLDKRLDSFEKAAGYLHCTA